MQQFSGIEGYSGIDFFERGFSVKTLTDVEEKEKAYAFRHRIFAEELGWVPIQRNGLDIDVYDAGGMVPLGVFDELGRIVAHVRITLPQRTFMMEGEFPDLLGNHVINKKADTVEVSRVCTEAGVRKTRLSTPYGKYRIAMLLYKGLYQWCLENAVCDMYMVIEYKLFRLLRLSGFPCQKIAEPVKMPDGVLAIATRVNWRKFEAMNLDSKPELLHWFTFTDTAVV